MFELDWFSRNSYNIALKNCAEWSPTQTLRLLQACLEVKSAISPFKEILTFLQFIDQYPSNIDVNSRADQSLRRMFCDFLCGSLLIMIARREDRISEQVCIEGPGLYLY